MKYDTLHIERYITRTKKRRMMVRIAEDQRHLNAKSEGLVVHSHNMRKSKRMVQVQSVELSACVFIRLKTRIGP